MKGTIHPDHIPKNKFSLRVRGLPEIVFIKIDGLEEELEVVEIPDRTRASGGNTKAGDFTAAVPTHHVEQIQAIEAWMVDSTDPVNPGYKKTGILTKVSITGMRRVIFTILGMFPSKRASDSSDMEDEGNMDTTTFTFNFDDIVPRYF